MADLSVPVILGTARPGRQSEQVARHVLDVIKQRGISTDLIDVAEYPLTSTAAAATSASYRAALADADGFVIVAPEYNHSYPGELKLLLDSEYQHYVRKPVGFVSVSTGRIGGARMVEQLRLVAAALRMVPIAPAVHVAEVAEAMDEHGRFSSASLGQVLDDMLDELEWFSSALASARSRDS